MNGGDWNDGMNRVNGESVWLGFFLSMVLRDFSSVAMLKNDAGGAERYRRICVDLLKNAERNFDGRKYSRAFFTDGRPVGGESFIDIIPQAFAVFAGADDERTKKALKEAKKRLYDPQNSIFALLSPPFSSDSIKSVGYISTYPEGIRENGGQYSHGAVWGIMAMAMAGLKDEAYEILKSINPARITQSDEGAKRYMAEPYFLAADVSTNPDTVGRCGWTLYTGSSGWFFNAVFDVFCGIRIMGDCFSVTPCLCASFPSFRLKLCFKDTEYLICVSSGEENKYLLDGKSVNNLFYFDKNHHYLEITVEISKEIE
jgi:cyclic beta-1,2-glucan synthetase